MTKRFLHILVVALLILLQQRCAQIAPLTGGKRDLNPPKLLEAIPANASVSFTNEVIILRFDEYVQVKDLPNQLIVSPKLKTTPQITADGKKIHIKLVKEELKPKTTYRIYFGKSVADMNESNILPNLEYVFSTGDYIDSLKLKGSVKEAFNNKPADKILVGLYDNDNTTDSLPYLQSPDYTAKTNEFGEFHFSNLPYRAFRMVAFSDANKNSVYDGLNEKISYLDSELHLSCDSTIHLKLFQEENTKKFIKQQVTPYYGFLQLFLNKKTKVAVQPFNIPDSARWLESAVNKEKDTIGVYYSGIIDTLNLLVRYLPENKTDTLKINLPKYKFSNKKFKTYTLNTFGAKLGLNQKLKLSFINWMDTARTNLKQLKLKSKDDSLIAKEAVSGHWLGTTDFQIDTKLKEGKNYTLKIDSNAFYALIPNSNDSGSFAFKTASKLEFGKVGVKLRLNKKQSYIIQLITAQEQVIKEQFISFSLSASNAVSVDFTDVAPGEYFVKIIYDDNKNNKWDSGNLLMKQQPESVIINSKQLKVLSDWEIEEEITIKE